MSTYIKTVFGRNVADETQPEVSLFEEGKLIFSSEQGTFLRKLLPKELPHGWFEANRGQFAVSNKYPFYNGFTLEAVEEDAIQWQYNNHEKGNIDYDLPIFKERGEKDFQRTLLFEKSQKELACVLVTMKTGGAFFLGFGNKMFFDVPPCLKPLYNVRAGAAKIHSSLEVRDDELIMGWRSATPESGILNPTFFRIYRKMIDL